MFLEDKTMGEPLEEWPDWYADLRRGVIYRTNGGLELYSYIVLPREGGGGVEKK